MQITGELSILLMYLCGENYISTLLDCNGNALGVNVLLRLFSYDDKIQNGTIQLQCGQKSSQGCIVAIFLDRASSIKT
uniref:Uncharacterized protein n=1 Tax=Glossina palpalis gambiensis TaxID=67801 RepID=A0A1B0ATK1_9MUSC